MQIDKIKGPLLHQHKPWRLAVQSEQRQYLTGKGIYYNWFAAFDTRNIAPAGWRVPTLADYNTLKSFLDPLGQNTAAPALKSNEAGTWTNQTGNTNSAKFNAIASGQRDELGNFKNLGEFVDFWYVCPLDEFISAAVLVNSGQIFHVPTYLYGELAEVKKAGLSIRLIKESTTLTHGQESTMQGNDLTIYPTICIGTQEFLAVNLAETKYRNGDVIPEVTDKNEWAAADAGARCTYNNEALTYQHDTQNIGENTELEFIEGDNINLTLSGGKLTISATGTDISGKVDKVTGKGLSTEDYTTAEKSKLAGIDLNTKVDKVTGKGLSTEDYTAAEKSKLAGIDLNIKVDKVAGKGLSTEDYTAAEKSKLAGIDLNTKVDKVTGKGLSTEDYTAAEKSKLAGIDTSALIFTPEIISTPTQGVKNRLYIFASSCALTLPASPANGDSLKVINLSDTLTCTIGRNGKKIMNLTEDLTLDKANAGFEIVFSGDSYGWVII